MLSIQEKREKRNIVAKQCRRLLDDHADNNWDVGKQETYDGYMREIEALDHEIRCEQDDLDRRASGALPGNGDQWVDIQTGQPVRVLSHSEHLAPPRNPSGVTFGRWMRGLLTGKRADDFAEFKNDLATSPDSAGGYTVPEELSREFIDRLRARMVLSRAGARTVEMNTKTLQIARIDDDAAVSWHAENAALVSTDPTFGAVTLTSRTVVGLVKLSLEMAQDALNVEEAITRSLTEGMAVAIDAAGLAGDGANNSPVGVANFAGRNTVTSIGAPANYDFFVDGLAELLVDNVALEDIGASIVHPRLWKDLVKLKTGLTSDQTPLMKPAALTQAMLPTTSAPVTAGSPDTTTAFQAQWSDLLYGVRSDIRIVPLREAFLGSNLQIALLCYARVDFQPARPQSFVTMEGIELA